MSPLGFFALLCAIILIPWALLAIADEINTRRDQAWDTEIDQALALTDENARIVPLRLSGPYTTELYLRAQAAAIEAEWAEFNDPDGAA